MKKSKHVILAAVAIAVIASVAAGAMLMTGRGNEAQTVEVGDTIKVDYTGTLTNGTEFDTSIGKAPLEFTVGGGEMIAGFDKGVVGMKLNEEKTITILADEAYGEKRQEMIVGIPLENFGDLELKKGMPISGGVGGQRIQGVVVDLNETTATVDFNHPLAGQTLVFKIKVVEIQKG